MLDLHRHRYRHIVIFNQNLVNFYFIFFTIFLGRVLKIFLFTGLSVQYLVQCYNFLLSLLRNEQLSVVVAVVYSMAWNFSILNLMNFDLVDLDHDFDDDQE